MTTGTTLLPPGSVETTRDRIRYVKLSTLTLPLDTRISDAKVLTGRQKPMTEIVFLFVEISTENDHHGIGFASGWMMSTDRCSISAMCDRLGRVLSISAQCSDSRFNASISWRRPGSAVSRRSCGSPHSARVAGSPP